VRWSVRHWLLSVSQNDVARSVRFTRHCDGAIHGKVGLHYVADVDAAMPRNYNRHGQRPPTLACVRHRSRTLAMLRTLARGAGVGYVIDSCYSSYSLTSAVTYVGRVRRRSQAR
jgi:hypothetical protein